MVILVYKIVVSPNAMRIHHCLNITEKPSRWKRKEVHIRLMPVRVREGGKKLATSFGKAAGN